jgi:hypothetical protein
MYKRQQQQYDVRGLTCVPALKIAPRAPFGPSDVLMLGMPFDGMATVLQWSAALRSDTYDISATYVALYRIKSTNLFFQR